MGVTRAQSEVVGVALLLGLTLVIVGVTVSIGSSAISQTSDQASIQQAENALSQFDSEASEVALGQSDSKRVDLGSANGDVRVTDAGSMTVTERNLSSGNTSTIANVSLGAVVYRRNGHTVAYQGGGVWRDGQIVSPPEVHYNSGTLTLPIVSVSGNARGNGGLRVHRGSAANVRFPDPSENRTNPLTGARVNVSVQSPYYEGWADYFRERTGGQVFVNDSAEIATITLTTPIEPVRVADGIVDESANTKLQFYGRSTIDGYNSTIGTYDNSKGIPVNVSTVGAVKIKSATINGNLIANGPVTFENSPDTSNITGAVYTDSMVTYPDWVDESKETPVHSSESNLADLPAATSRIYSAKNRAESSNDNSNSSVISDHSLSCPDTDCELDSGTYYLDRLSVGGTHHLWLNTTQGDITLVVDGDVTVGGSGRISTTGSGRVNVFTTGDTTIEGRCLVNTINTTTDTRTNRASAFWLYALPDSSVLIDGSGEFTGVVYGAGDQPQPGTSIDVPGSGTIYGALIGDVNGVHQSGALHYDHALNSAHTALNTEQPHTSTVNYLHVSVENVTVSDGNARPGR
ncbi:DUF7289 family protein [Halarchaeum acidiphilum]|uniref:DUF7289 family protein n=1 Tax=Halarchaeum acidiphilum TaxID=489138 RepID=UPI000AD77E7F|nr:hypothetical protein [Halarchaeum acidiphilum]